MSSYAAHGNIARCELESHTDTCAFGRHAFIIQEMTQVVSVAGFHPDMKEIQKVKVVTAAVAYDCPFTLVTYILIFPQSLYFPRMNHNLICPDQLREFGLTVNEIPLLRMQPVERTPEHHSIINQEIKLHIALKYDKPISYFECRKPTSNKVADTIKYVHVQMTSPCE